MRTILILSLLGTVSLFAFGGCTSDDNTSSETPGTGGAALSETPDQQVAADLTDTVAETSEELSGTIGEKIISDTEPAKPAGSQSKLTEEKKVQSSKPAKNSTAPPAESTTKKTDMSTQLEKDIALLKTHLSKLGVSNFKQTESGLIYTVEKQGSGDRVTPGNTVSVHYTGKTLDGNKFDSSVDRGQPLTFPIGKGQVIPGWDEGIPLFNVGGKGTLYIPSTLAYGDRGFPGAIEPNSPLVFDIEVIDSYDQEARAREAAQRNQVEIEAYLKANKLQALRTENGLYYIVEEAGEGAKAQPGQRVSVHYVGTFLDGRKFDSSVDRGEPFTFELGKGQVIRGWDEGLQLFAKGGKGKLLIPSNLGYGSMDRGTIPPNSVLLFDVELVDIN